MAFYSYKMTRDYGFAPNPFGGVCTLATCKPHIRKIITVGDWIIGTGAKEIKLEGRLIYLMQVTEKILLEDYWIDPRYQFKKPILNGSLITLHGDNVYSKDTEGNWIQAPCQHSHPNFEPNTKHLTNDISGKYALISDFFYYFGHNHIEVPKTFASVCSKVRDYASPRILNEEECQQFVDWIATHFNKGVHGKPINWIEYAQRSLAFLT